MDKEVPRSSHGLQYFYSRWRFGKENALLTPLQRNTHAPNNMVHILPTRQTRKQPRFPPTGHALVRCGRTIEKQTSCATTKFGHIFYFPRRHRRTANTKTEQLSCYPRESDPRHMCIDIHWRAGGGRGWPLASHVSYTRQNHPWTSRGRGRKQPAEPYELGSWDSPPLPFSRATVHRPLLCLLASFSLYIFGVEGMLSTPPPPPNLGAFFESCLSAASPSVCSVRQT